jgi:hypothetical protein
VPVARPVEGRHAGETMLRDFRASLNLRSIAALGTLTTIGLAAPLQAQTPRAACLARHYAAYASAQRDYQRTVERVAASDTVLRPLATLVRAEQVARIDARQRAVETLLRTSPRAVRVDRPANQWLDWGPAEAERLARTDTVFARLDAAARAAAEPLRGHPGWSGLREAMRGRVQSSPEQRAALARLTAAMNARPSCG